MIYKNKITGELTDSSHNLNPNLWEKYISATSVSELTQQQLNVDIKQAKLKALSEIVVTTAAGNTFDGDDAGRESMLSAIEAASFLGLTEHNWKLSDNTWKVITLNELKEAHALSIQAKGVILAS